MITWAFRAPDLEAKLAVLFGFMAVEACVPLGATYLLDRCCAAWTPPDPEPWPAERGRRFMAQVGAVASADDLVRLGAMQDAMDAVHPHFPHWYLGMIGTEPDARGGGLGSVVLAHTLERVDADGLPAYLESTNPRNVSLYLRHGFEVTGTITVPDGPSMTAMVRPAAVVK